MHYLWKNFWDSNTGLDIKKQSIKTITVRPRNTRPWTARTLQVHVSELGPKKFEMNLEQHGFLIILPSPYLVTKVARSLSCMSFFLSVKNVHLKALLYLILKQFQWPYSPLGSRTKCKMWLSDHSRLVFCGCGVY